MKQVETNFGYSPSLQLLTCSAATTFRNENQLQTSTLQFSNLKPLALNVVAWSSTNYVDLDNT